MLTTPKGGGFLAYILMEIKNETMPVAISLDVKDGNLSVNTNITIKDLKSLLEGNLQFIKIDCTSHLTIKRIGFFLGIDGENAYISTRKIVALNFDEKLYKIMSTIYDIECILDNVESTEFIRKKINKETLENTLEIKYDEYSKYIEDNQKKWK